MTLFVITLGFEEKFAVRMITRHGLDRGDRILLVTGPSIAQSEKTISFLNDFVSKYYSSKVKVEVFRLNPTDGFENLVRALFQALQQRTRQGEKIIFNLSGGMRSICLAALIVAQLLSTAGTDVEAELETEDATTFLSLPPASLNLPRIAAELTPEKIEILQRLTGREATVKKLAEQLGRDETTLSRHLRALTALGLLQTRPGKPAAYRAAELAPLLASALTEHRTKQKENRTEKLENNQKAGLLNLPHNR